MSAHDARGVFISYAREDRGPVMLAARLLRAGGATVFLDVHGIPEGEKWEPALKRAIERCERIMVFWSAAAAASQWVEREWRAALALNKRIVPLMLDATPLPPPLAEYQGVPDLVEMLDQARREEAVSPSSEFQPIPRPAPLSPPRRAFGWPLGAGALAVSALAGLVGLQLLRGDGPKTTPADVLPGPPVGASMPASGAPGGVEMAAAPGMMALLLALVALAAVLVAWRWRQRRSIRREAALHPQAPGDKGDLPHRFTNAVFGDA